MPRRFPGVDPYIEDQGYWPDFHARFITYVSDLLNDRLPRGYQAVIDQQFRLYDTSEPKSLGTEPDVAIVGRRESVARLHEGAVAVLEPVVLTMAEHEPDQGRHTWIEIRRFPERDLVSVIEILPPTNKYGRGREEYLHKRRAYMRQDVHLIEIDLLLRGARLPMEGRFPAGDYCAIIARAGSRPLAEVYAWSIRRPFPSIPIPLRPPDRDILLDLAIPYESAFDRGRYAQWLDYGAPLEAPLDAADRSWASALATG